jgi:O-acetyl-ADP-ribose deacetylase (regulator of RNase III)
MTETKTRFSLVDINPEMIAAWRHAFAGTEVKIIEGDFRQFKDYDCLVSPGNSFGLMDGGFDLIISHHLGWDIMKQVQTQIRHVWHGMQPVGTCLLVPYKNIWLAHAPTMRLPENISRKDNVYMAFWAILNAVHNHTPPLRHVICPGLGTGIGGMDPTVAAQQMRLAWDHFHQLKPLSQETTGPSLRIEADDGTISMKPRTGDYVITWEDAVQVNQDISSSV